MCTRRCCARPSAPTLPPRSASGERRAAENSRIVQELMADAKKKIDAFKNIPKLTELAKKSEGELISTFGISPNRWKR